MHYDHSTSTTRLAPKGTGGYLHFQAGQLSKLGYVYVQIFGG